jgi:hypothetical protein
MERATYINEICSILSRSQNSVSFDEFFKTYLDCIFSHVL